jgi:rhodanese-related sulfurtransferase
MGGMFAGTALTPAAWPLVKDVVSVQPREGATLATDLGIPLGIVVLLLTIAGVLVMIIGRLMDSRGFTLNPFKPTAPESVALALAATFALSDGRVSLPATRAGAIAAEIEREADHIDAIALAEAIKAGEPGLRIIDLREGLDTSTYMIPGARSVSLTALDTLRLDPAERLVLYSDGGAHAAQAWVLLRVRGVRNALVLKDGMAAWEDEVLSPAVPTVPDDSAKARFARAKELSRWFGGFPRLVPDESSSSTALRPRRRRTC